MLEKREHGRDEPIIDPDLPIVDAHIHLFDRPPLSYLFDDYLADATAGHRIVASVYVETQAFVRRDGPEVLRPLGEVEFANGVAAMAASGAYGPCRVAAGIVGHADLRLGAAVGALLDRCLAVAPDRYRGVRQITLDHPSDAPYRYMSVRPPRDVLDHPRFREGFAEIGRRGLTFDAAIFHNQLGDLAALADAFPDTVIVLNHLGYAMALGEDAAGRRAVFAAWRDGLRAIARRANVICKVGGLGMVPWGFGLDQRREPVGYRELADTWRPYVEEAIAAFGVERCMMQSNYPPDARTAGYVPLWNALKHLTAGCSAGEKAALFHGTATRIYRLALPADARSAAAATMARSPSS